MKFLYPLLISFSIFFCIFYFFYFSKKNKRSGAVIILNGPSASGKSSIQKEFQALMMPKLWINLIQNICFGLMGV